MGREHADEYDDDEYDDDDEYEAAEQLKSDYGYTEDDFEAMKEDGTTAQDALEDRRGEDALDEIWGKD